MNDVENRMIYKADGSMDPTLLIGVRFRSVRAENPDVVREVIGLREDERGALCAVLRRDTGEEALGPEVVTLAFELSQSLKPCGAWKYRLEDEFLQSEAQRQETRNRKATERDS